MKIGITYDLKTDGQPDATLPDDFQEEFDSPHTIEAIANVLRGLGHSVVFLGDGRDFLKRILADRPDLVFNIAEGIGHSRSREARVPAVLEMLGIPHTGSDPLTLAVTLDKSIAKTLVSAAGIPVPRGLVVDSSIGFERSFAEAGLRFPVIVKPAWEGSSKGIRNRCLVKSPNDLADVVASLRRDHEQPILIEQFLPGDELTVGILGNDRPQILGIMKVVPKTRSEHFVYSLEIKRDFRRLVAYECPARLPADTERQIREYALNAYRILGCRDVARIDFRLDENGIPHFLEVNPLPGLHPEDSDLVIMAGLIGWNYPKLIQSILDEAIGRHQISECGGSDAALDGRNASQARSRASSTAASSQRTP